MRLGCTSYLLSTPAYFPLTSIGAPNPPVAQQHILVESSAGIGSPSYFWAFSSSAMKKVDATSRASLLDPAPMRWTRSPKIMAIRSLCPAWHTQQQR